MPDEQKPHSFWTTIPGILAGIAALLTAITGLYIAFRPTPPVRQPDSAAPTVTASPHTAAKPQGTPKPADKIPDAPVPSPRPQVHMSGLKDGEAYLQADIYSRATDSAVECAEICRSDSRCMAMTFIKSQKLCWIKGSVPATAASSDMVSARKLSQ